MPDAASWMRFLVNVVSQGLDDAAPPPTHLPASKAALSALSRGVWHDKHTKHGSECTVCLDAFASGQQACSLPCGHMFHEDKCIMPWLREHNTCPTCRFALSTEDAEFNERNSIHSPEKATEIATERGVAWPKPRRSTRKRTRDGDHDDSESATGTRGGTKRQRGVGAPGASSPTASDSASDGASDSAGDRTPDSGPEPADSDSDSEDGMPPLFMLGGPGGLPGIPLGALLGPSRGSPFMLGGGLGGSLGGLGGSLGLGPLGGPLARGLGGPAVGGGAWRLRWLGPAPRGGDADAAGEGESPGLGEGEGASSFS
jgi:hypothetical protein